MYITKLYLKNYKRLFLNNIKELTYTPKNKIQLILGSNGSGKSSLLSMLNPLPADIKKDFEQDGCKEIHITHNKKEFILISTLNRHSFLLDGKELNHGYTRRVQEELIQEYFKVDKNIYNILLQNDNFCNMNSTLKREWITKACKSDFTYAINLFNKLKSNLRDKNGAIKILKDEIQNNENNILSNKQYKELKEQKTYISKMIDILLTSTTIEQQENITNIASTMVVKDHTSFREVSYISKELSKCINKYNINFNKNNLNKQITICKTNIENLDKSINTLNDKISILNKKLKIKKDVNTLNKELKYVNKNIEQLEKDMSSYTNYLNKDNVNIVYNDFINTNIITYLNQLEDYSELNITKNYYDTLVESINSNEKRIGVLTNKIETLKKDIEKGDNITCSNCGFINNTNVNIKECNYYIEKYQEELDNYIKNNETNRNIIKDINLVISILDKIKICISNNSYPIYKTILSNDILKNIPNIITQINRINASFKKWIELPSYYNKRDEIINSINILNTNKDIEEGKLQKHISNLKNIVKERCDLIKELDLLKSYNIIIDKVNILSLKLKSELNKVYKQRDVLIKNIKNNLLKELIKELKNIYIDIDTKISNYEFYLNKIKSDKILLEKINNESKYLNILINSLSPSDGIISKCIGAFIDVIIEDMNTIINSVWSYDMKIMNFNYIEGEEITYKFNILVDNRELIDDVNKLSSSMKDIVNLAFKITIMKYLGIINVPLYLDEFGNTMDDVHRDTAYKIIDKTLSMGFGQVFLISHYESSYGRFKNADIIVLDNKNLILNTKNYNEQLKIG